MAYSLRRTISVKQTVSIKNSNSDPILDFGAQKAARASSRWPIIFGDLQRTRFFVESSECDTFHNTTTVLLRLQSRDVFADIQYSPINCTCCYVDISPIFSPYFFLVHRFLLNHLWWTIIRISLPKQQRLQ